MEEVEEEEDCELKPTNGLFEQHEQQLQQQQLQHQQLATAASTVMPSAVSLTPVRGAGELAALHS